MPGPKSIRTAAAYITACIAAACVAVAAEQFPRQSVGAPAKEQAASRCPMLGPGAQFIGWRGETALFREETYRQNGASRITYYAMDPRSRATAIPKSRIGQLAGSVSGTVLLADYIPVPGETAVVFRLEADPQEVDALQSAIQTWLEQGSGKAQSFPLVHAELIVKLVQVGKKDTVWRQRRDLTATTGEGGYVYDPPRLRFAVLSPAESTLLVELVNGVGSEFIRIPLLSRE